MLVQQQNLFFQPVHCLTFTAERDDHDIARADGLERVKLIRTVKRQLAGLQEIAVRTGGDDDAPAVDIDKLPEEVRLAGKHIVACQLVIGDIDDGLHVKDRGKRNWGVFHFHDSFTAHDRFYKFCTGFYIVSSKHKLIMEL